MFLQVSWHCQTLPGRWRSDGLRTGEGEVSMWFEDCGLSFSIFCLHEKSQTAGNNRPAGWSGSTSNSNNTVPTPQLLPGSRHHQDAPREQAFYQGIKIRSRDGTQLRACLVLPGLRHPRKWQCTPVTPTPHFQGQRCEVQKFKATLSYKFMRPSHGKGAKTDESDCASYMLQDRNNVEPAVVPVLTNLSPQP